MTFDEAMEFMNLWHGSRLGLERMTELMERLGHPERELSYVHVAGTNGKGSTCAMLESVLSAAGYRTGMFTSPWLETVLESIRIDGCNITETDFCRAVECVERAILGKSLVHKESAFGTAEKCCERDPVCMTEETDAARKEPRCGTEKQACEKTLLLCEMEDKPTEFEILTAAAICAFADAACDIVIMEVGMGGRLDSTNIIPPPEVCAITNLSLEHTQFLGNTLDKIAFEKAGIIKEGCDVITYPAEAVAEEVYRTVAAARGATWRRADMDAIRISITIDKGSGCEDTVRGGRQESGQHSKEQGIGQPVREQRSKEQGIGQPVREQHSKEQGISQPEKDRQGSDSKPDKSFSWHGYRDLTIALDGMHQVKNAVMVLEITEKLRTRGWDISEEAVREGLSAVRWPARFEILRREPLFICDGSHNPQCIEMLRDNIRDMLPNTRVTFLMGVLADKDYSRMLDLLWPHAKAFVCVAPDNPRALGAENLAECIRNRQLSPEANSNGAEGDVLKVPAFAEKSIADGLKRAVGIAGDGPVIACGSLYMMGKVRKEFFQMAKKERIDEFFRFLLEIDKEKFIGRQTYLSDGKRKENDSEHAWHMAIMAWLLSEYANEKVDIARTMLMILIHDLVEIDAGDTYAYDMAARESQRERELAAADRIFGLLPHDMGEKLRDVWEEFEAWETPEARYARALDNFQPLMLNAATDGISWVEHGVRLSQVIERNQRSKLGSEVLWEYVYHNFIEPNVEKGRIIDDLGDKKDDII